MNNSSFIRIDNNIIRKNLIVNIAMCRKTNKIIIRDCNYNEYHLRVKKEKLNVALEKISNEIDPNIIYMKHFISSKID